MALGLITRLGTAIGYPDRIPAGASSFTFLVDGMEVRSVEADGVLRLSHALEASADDLPFLADWAVGRMMRDEAALAVSPSGEPFLWDEAPAGCDDAALKRVFEMFMNSCDWWHQRLEERSGDGAPRFPDVLIRP